MLNDESFFESQTWKTHISKQIINNLDCALPYSRFIYRKYKLNISTTLLMKKAKELQYTKPKTKIPKNMR